IRTDLQQVRHGVGHVQTVESGTHGAVGPLHGAHDDKQRQASLGQHIRKAAPAALAEGIHDENAASEHQQQNFRRRQREVEIRLLHSGLHDQLYAGAHSACAPAPDGQCGRNGHSLDTAICSSNACTETCITSVNGLGYTPMYSVASARMPRMANSRVLTSVSARTLSLATSPSTTRLTIHSE